MCVRVLGERIDGYFFSSSSLFCRNFVYPDVCVAEMRTLRSVSVRFCSPENAHGPSRQKKKKPSAPYYSVRNASLQQEVSDGPQKSHSHFDNDFFSGPTQAVDDFFGVSVVQMFRRERSAAAGAKNNFFEKLTNEIKHNIDQMKFENIYFFNSNNPLRFKTKNQRILFFFCDFLFCIRYILLTFFFRTVFRIISQK